MTNSSPPSRPACRCRAIRAQAAGAAAAAGRRRMAERVVDLLEPVEIEQSRANLAQRLAPRQGFLQLDAEPPPESPGRATRRVRADRREARLGVAGVKMWPAISRFLLRKSFHDTVSLILATAHRFPMRNNRSWLIFSTLYSLLPVSSHPAANCFARSVARITALISVTRNPPSSNSRMPSIVHPAGVVTASLSSAGW